MPFLLCQQWVRPWADLSYCHPWDSEGDEAWWLSPLDNAWGIPAEKPEVCNHYRGFLVLRHPGKLFLSSGLPWWTLRSRIWQAPGRQRWLLVLLSLTTLSLIILEGEPGWYEAHESSCTLPFSDSTWCARHLQSTLLCRSITMSELGGLQPLLRNITIPRCPI